LPNQKYNSKVLLIFVPEIEVKDAQCDFSSGLLQAKTY